MNLVKWYKACVKEAGISGQKTNHSFRATSASQLFQANVPEIIQERTGHRSTDALRLYERTTEQHKGVTQVLSSNLDISYTFVFQQCKALKTTCPCLNPCSNQLILHLRSINMSGCTVNITFLIKLHLHHFQPLCQKS